MTNQPPSDFKRARVYDGVAEAYERVNLPRLFGEPGRVLAELAAPAPGERVLDVGAGTGAVARALRDHAAGRAQVVLADASASMLCVAQTVGLDHCVVCSAPPLPFSDGVFDAVTSAFVMTHVDDADAVALEMWRVLRPGGRAALSAWLPPDDDAAREWSRVIRTFIEPRWLEAGLRETLPGDARFAQAGSLGEMLKTAGFTGVTTREHRVDCSMSVDDYITSRCVAATGRAMRALLPSDRFEEMREAARASLTGMFPAGVDFSRGFHTASGVRPAA